MSVRVEIELGRDGTFQNVKAKSFLDWYQMRDLWDVIVWAYLGRRRKFNSATIDFMVMHQGRLRKVRVKVLLEGEEAVSMIRDKTSQTDNLSVECVSGPGDESKTVILELELPPRDKIWL